MKRYFAGVPPPEIRPPTFAVYARVLLQMLDDLTLTGEEFDDALRWFTESLEDVEIVCTLCALKPAYVYREVSRRLRATGVESQGIERICERLAAGVKLTDISLSI